MENIGLKNKKTPRVSNPVIVLIEPLLDDLGNTIAGFGVLGVIRKTQLMPE